MPDSLLFYASPNYHSDNFSLLACVPLRKKLYTTTGGLYVLFLAVCDNLVRKAQTCLPHLGYAILFNRLRIKWPLEPKDQGHTSFNTTLLGQLPKGCTLLGSNSRAAFRSLRNARLSVFSRGYPKIVGSKSHGAAATAKNAYHCEKSLL